MAYLGHPDKDTPVPKIPMPEGLYDEHGNATGRDSSGREITPAERLERIRPHALNSLLRALIRTEVVEGLLSDEATMGKGTPTR